MQTNNNIEPQETYSTTSISEFDRNKPRETYKKINDLLSDLKVSAFMDRQQVVRRLEEIRRLLEEGR